MPELDSCGKRAGWCCACAVGKLKPLPRSGRMGLHTTHVVAFRGGGARCLVNEQGSNLGH